VGRYHPRNAGIADSIRFETTQAEERQMNFFELWRTAFANWFEANRNGPKAKPRWRQYRHHAARTDYIPAPPKGWHYQQGKLVRNGSRN
jgi:hypothetical protein